MKNVEREDMNTKYSSTLAHENSLLNVKGLIGLCKNSVVRRIRNLLDSVDILCLQEIIVGLKL
jgi:hypothetical protein